jgi:cytochrome P450
MQTGLFQSEGTTWTRIRKSTSPSFSNLNITAKFPSIVEEMDDWMLRMKAKLDANEEKKEKKEHVFDMKYETFSLAIRIITIVGFGLSTKSEKDEEKELISYFFSSDFNADIANAFSFVLHSALFPLPKPFFWKLFGSKYYTEIEARKVTQRINSSCQAIINYKKRIYENGNHTSHSMIDSLLFPHSSTATSSESGKYLAYFASFFKFFFFSMNFVFSFGCIDFFLFPDRFDTFLPFCQSLGPAAPEKNERGLSEEEIIANMKTFFLAGTDTTAVTITWIMFYFATKPEIHQKAREEVEKILLSSFPDYTLPLSQEVLSSFTVAKVKELHYCQGLLKETLRLKGEFLSFVRGFGRAGWFFLLN